MPDPRDPYPEEPRGPGRPPGGPGGPGGTLEGWLAEQVPLLPPPPGTLERIRRRARRRKLGRALTAVAGAAVLIAGVAALPPLVLSQLRGSSQPAGDIAGQTMLPTPGGRPASPPRPNGSGTLAPTLPPVPPNFAPTSVTFVGTGTGWVIGQAGSPGRCGPPNPDICTSIARTDDYGHSWYGVPAPVAGPPDGARGVSQIRFLNTRDGWVFGPELWATHDGGQTWTRIPTHGLRVTALETRGSAAYAVWAKCSGGGASYAAQCTSFTLYTAPAQGDDWQPVPGATANLTAGGAPSSALLLLAGSGSYLLPPGGGLVAGPAAGNGPWQPAAAGLLGAPCAPGVPGQPGGALLAETGTGRLVLLCTTAGGGSAGGVFASTDGGRSWQPAGQATAAGTATSLSGSLSGALILATSQGIAISPDGGSTWQAAQVASTPPGGFSYVGMTTAQQGVAVPADPGQHAVWITYDGGRTWQPSPVSS
jgi:hypothetical protein